MEQPEYEKLREYDDCLRKTSRHIHASTDQRIKEEADLPKKPPEMAFPSKGTTQQ